MPEQPIKVLFVCLGNICRSPLAEVIAKHTAEKLNLSSHFHFESAGTGDWHIGGKADPRSSAIALQYGLDLSKHRAQQVTTHNIHQWDYWVAMDHENRLNLLAMGASNHKVLMMRQFEENKENMLDIGSIQAVADPYYGGAHGFENAYQILSHNAEALLKHILERHGETKKSHLQKQ